MFRMNFPSLHARIYRYGDQLYSLYEIGQSLSTRQMQQLIAALHQKGLAIESLEFFEYGPSNTLRHLFVRIKGQSEAMPYFQLNPDDWRILVEELSKMPVHRN